MEALCTVLIIKLSTVVISLPTIVSARACMYVGSCYRHDTVLQLSLKAHLHGILEAVSVLCNEAIAHVSGMQSSCKGHNNIIACSASCSKHKVKDDFACCKYIAVVKILKSTR